ncbi:MAG TPA: hypothetical protein PLJ08_13530 [Cyclobacteriaceae bacterium]|nr:hypothetical protein [Cyclobacteriaceae bacterium]
MNADKVILEPLEHRGANCIAFKPGLTGRVYDVMRKLPGVLFTKTHNRWYVVNDKPAVFDKLFNFFNKEKQIQNLIFINQKKTSQNVQLSLLAVGIACKHGHQKNPETDNRQAMLKHG